jgi:hypothetical protein
MVQKIIYERGTYPPPGSLRSPSGTLRGKTNDESFAQNTQLSPVLMLPSHTLRDISCFNDFKILKSKSQKIKRFAALSYKSKKLERLKAWPFGPRYFVSGPFGLKAESASLTLSYKSLKDERLKGVKTFKVLKSKGASVPSATNVILLSG